LVAAATVADAVEVDVRRCADGKLILSHDPDLSGYLVTAHEWAFLGELDLGGGHHPALLDEALGAVPDTPVLLEVKNLPHQPGYEPDHRIGHETASRARPGDVVTSFHWPTVDAVHLQFPDVATGLIVGEWADLGHAMEHCLDVGHSAVVPDVELLHRDENRQLIAETALDVFVWTVNDPREAAELAAIGVSGIITDDPGLISFIREKQ
jgi:glycerophosphoryl diester phosphodiesterase